MDLSGLPDNYEQDFELSTITSNVYAIVQVGQYLKEDDDWELSQLLSPVRKLIGGFTGGMVSHLKLYLAPLHSFRYDCIMIPDIGGRPNDCLELMAHKNWASTLIEWFDSRARDDISDASTEDGENSIGNYDEEEHELAEVTDSEPEESDPTDDEESD